MPTYHVALVDPNVEPETDEHRPTPVQRGVDWYGVATTHDEARQMTSRAWAETYGEGTEPVNGIWQITEIDPAIAAASEWLSRFIGVYAGMDTGAGDPVHAVRTHAQELLDAGPTADDPVTICREIEAALPHDARAHTLEREWLEQLDSATR